MKVHSCKELYSNMKVKNGTKPVKRVGQNIQKRSYPYTLFQQSHNLVFSVSYYGILTLYAVNYKLIHPQLNSLSLEPNLNTADTHLLPSSTHSQSGKQACVPG